MRKANRGRVNKKQPFLPLYRKSAHMGKGQNIQGFANSEIIGAALPKQQSKRVNPCLSDTVREEYIAFWLKVKAEKPV